MHLNFCQRKFLIFVNLFLLIALYLALARPFQDVYTTLYQQGTQAQNRSDVTSTSGRANVSWIVAKVKKTAQDDRFLNKNDNIKNVDYKALLATVAKNNTVMLSIVDAGFLDMVINFYMGSIKRFGITNFLLLAIDDNACGIVHEYSIPCAMYRQYNLSAGASKYGSKEFNAKMSVRSEILINVLALGYTVLHVDTDLTFYANPLNDISCPEETCHVTALNDCPAYNAGFVLLHAQEFSRRIYEGMMYIQKKSPELTEQVRFNQMIYKLKQDKRFKIQMLPGDKYQCGKKFYENRFFADTAPPCPQCVVVHNNWIKGMNKKILRAKELHQWWFDKHGYYSNASAKYLTYENPTTASVTLQLTMLQRALTIGRLLERDVILPKFSTKDHEIRPLLYIVKEVADLDAEFREKYREHSFLSHPLVPKAVRTSSFQVSIDADMNSTDLQQQFLSHTQSVLQFGTLDHKITFTDPAEQVNMQDKIKRAGLNKPL